MLNKYNTFIFDLDGTLIDSSPDIIDGVNYTLNKFNLPPRSNQEIMNNVGKGLKYLLQQVLPSDFSQEDILKAYYIQKEYYEIKKILAKPYKGVIELLDTLEKNTKNIFLVTNKPQKATLEVLKSLNLTKYFKNIFGADALKEHKPSPYPIQYIAQKYNLKYDKMLFIGDSITDYETAQNAEIDFVFVKYGYESKNITAKYKVDNILDLLSLNPNL